MGAWPPGAEVAALLLRLRLLGSSGSRGWSFVLGGSHLWARETVSNHSSNRPAAVEVADETFLLNEYCKNVEKGFSFDMTSFSMRNDYFGRVKLDSEKRMDKNKISL